MNIASCFYALCCEERKTANRKTTTGSVVFIVARITYISFLHRSAHIYFSYVSSNYLPLGRFIWIQHYDQLPVGLLAQLVERCTGIAEVMGSNPVQA